MTAFLLLLKSTLYAQGSLKLMSKLLYRKKVDILRASVQCHIASVTFKNGKQ